MNTITLSFSCGLLNVTIVNGRTATCRNFQVETGGRGAASLIVTTDDNHNIVNVLHGADGTKLGKRYGHVAFTNSAIVSAANEGGWNQICSEIFG